MSSAPVRSATPKEVLRILSTHRDRWIKPTIICAALSVVYALMMSRYWEASQSLILRQESNDASPNQPGKFTDLFEMRTLQETILELAKSRQVVIATLKGVSEDDLQAKEPTDEEIEKFRERLQMLPPNGAEFGKTEVFYLTVKDPSRKHAIRLVEELCDQLDRRLGQLRDERAQSLIAELDKKVDMATVLHDTETHRLVEFEGKLGADLGELRMLHSSFSGQSDLRQQLVQLEAESRQTKTRLREAEQLLTLLQVAEQDSEKIVAMPSSLLVAQPALSRLKDGLVDAQLRTARLGGNRSSEHPRVKAAFASEEEIRHDLHDELQTAILGAQVDRQLLHERNKAVTSKLQNVQQRLSRLAEQRAEYSNRVAAVASTRAVLDKSRQKLIEVQASQAAAHSSSLVSRIDKPETGPNPVGPRRAIIVMAGTLGGLIFGLGYLFLTLDPVSDSHQLDGLSESIDNISAENKISQVRPELEHPTEWWEADKNAQQVEQRTADVILEGERVGSNVEIDSTVMASTVTSADGVHLLTEKEEGDSSESLEADVPDDNVVEIVDVESDISKETSPPLHTTSDLADSLYAGMSLHDALSQVATQQEVALSR